MRTQGEGFRSLVKTLGGSPDGKSLGVTLVKTLGGNHGENNLVYQQHPFMEGNQERSKYKVVS